MERKAEIHRKTTETDISLAITIDGKGESKIQSGNGFMDHMLALFTKHGLFDLHLMCKGDTYVDFHHSIEDIGICLGQAVHKAIGDAKGIIRYGTIYIPMDEALTRVCIDIGGRPNLVYSVSLVDRTIGMFDCDLIEDFLKAFTDNARVTLHVDLLRGRNSHHAIEAIFKAFGRVLSLACAINPRSRNELPTTKGLL